MLVNPRELALIVQRTINGIYRLAEELTLVVLAVRLVVHTVLDGHQGRSTCVVRSCSGFDDFEFRGSLGLSWGSSSSVGVLASGALLLGLVNILAPR